MRSTVKQAGMIYGVLLIDLSSHTRAPSLAAGDSSLNIYHLRTGRLPVDGWRQRMYRVRQ
jgi:hypothetical protein